MPRPPAARVSRSVEVDAPPEHVWALVSDLPGMGRFSPEATGGRWVRGGGPAVGAVFRGTNAAGARRWSTRSTVVACEPGRAFVFDVAVGGLPVARWSYDLEPREGGCVLTETWQDRRGVLLDRLGKLVTGRGAREAFTADSIAQTLRRVKQQAEQGTPTA